MAFFVIGLVSLALSQPNAVFSLGVFLVPYCVMQSHRGGVCLRDKKGWKQRRFCARLRALRQSQRSGF
ncbi:MAG: DUF6541 family protein [Slackia sp.]